MVQFDGLFPHPCLHGIHLHCLVLYRSLTVFQSFQTFQPCPLLCTPCSAAALRPLQLHPKDTLPFALRCQFHLLPLGLQLQESGIIGIIAVHISPADLQDPVGDLVQEVAVMGHHEYHAPVLPQVLFQPDDHLLIQMIGRLVKQQNVKIRGQHFSHSHLPSLPP